MTGILFDLAGAFWIALVIICIYSLIKYLVDRYHQQKREDIYKQALERFQQDWIDWATKTDLRKD